MRAYIEGIRVVDFKDDAGKTIKGLRAFYQYKDPDCLGIASDSLFVKYGTEPYDYIEAFVTELVQSGNDDGGLGIPVNLDFNNKGRLIGVSFLDESGIPWEEPVVVAKGGVNDEKSDGSN